MVAHTCSTMVITHSHFLGRRFCVITPNFRARFLRLQTRVSRIVWKGFAPLSLAVSTVVRTSASAWAAHMARNEALEFFVHGGVYWNEQT